jgi:hypothetical protein
VDPTVVGSIVFAFSFGGALLGMWAQSILPQHHLDSDSKDTVKVGIGLVATMTALVLGLVTASAKSSFDAVNATVQQTAVDILTLDRALARYGAETQDIRHGLKKAVKLRIDTIWTPNGSQAPALLDPLHAGTGLLAERLDHDIRLLVPRDDVQRALQARALTLSEQLLEARWMVLAGSETSVPRPFLVVLLFWLSMIFGSFGLFAPRNPTVVATLAACALSVGSAMFLVLEMDMPFSGLLRVSADPLHFALRTLGG